MSPPTTAVGKPEWWEAAREQLSENVAITEYGPLSALLDVIGEAWTHLRVLHDAAADARATVEPDSSTAALLDFIQSDVLDAFRSLAEDCTGFVSAVCGAGEAPETDDVRGDAADLACWIAVLGFASSSRTVPERLSTVMRQTADALQGWEKRFAARLDRVAGVE